MRVQFFARDIDILANRRQVYEQARQNHPERWIKGTRNWSRKDAVHLNSLGVEKVGKPNK